MLEKTARAFFLAATAFEMAARCSKPRSKNLFDMVVRELRACSKGLSKNLFEDVVLCGIALCPAVLCSPLLRACNSICTYSHEFVQYIYIYIYMYIYMCFVILMYTYYAGEFSVCALRVPKGLGGLFQGAITT